MKKLQSQFNQGVQNMLKAKPLKILLIVGLLLPTSFYLLRPEKASADWFSFNWNYRIKVTIQSSQIDSDLTDFPVYLDMSDFPANFWTNVNSDCADVRITTSDGLTEVPREVVWCTTGSSIGEIHFKAPSLSSSADTDFYVYHGNAAATEPAITATYGAENVWNSSYLLVQHMNEDPSASAPQMIDSTDNSNDGTSAGSMTSGDLVSGRLGNGLDLDGVNDAIAKTSMNHPTGADPISISAWIRPTSVADRQFTRYGNCATVPTNGGSSSLGIRASTEKMYNWVHNQGSAVGLATMAINTWYNVTWVYDDGAGTGLATQLYLNGVADGNGGSSGTLNMPANSTFYIGANPCVNWITTSFHQGKIDEVRMTNTSLSSDWVAAEYTNQNTPTTFYTVASQEIRPTTWYNANWNYRIKVTIQSSEVDADLTDFPVYLDMSDFPANFWTNVNSDCSDVRITKSDVLTEVPREVVWCTGGSSIGEIHFKGDLSSSVDTVFYVYYGNAGASDYAIDATFGAENVWTNSFEAVYHLEDTNPGVEVLDSTSNSYDLSEHHDVSTGTALDATDSVDLKIGKGVEFESAKKQGLFNLVDPFGNYPFSMGGWVEMPTGGTPRGSHWVGDKDVADKYFEYSLNTSLKVVFVARNTITQALTPATTYSGQTIFVTAVVRSATDREIYVNGASVSGGSGQTSVTYPSVDQIAIGYGADSSENYGSSIMDEARFWSKSLSTAEISAQYTNQNTPTTFYTIGSQQGEGTRIINIKAIGVSTSIIANWYNVSWDYRVKITIQSSQVDSGLTDFPVYLDLSDLPAGFHTNVNQTDARDIRITTSDGVTEVPREIVFYTAASDTGEVHFKGTLSSSANTAFYIYYGNSSATEPAADATYGAENAWNSNYKGVWHMDSTTDSTGNSNDLSVGYGSPVLTSDGKFGDAYALTSDGFLAGSNLGITSYPVTMEAWANHDTGTGFTNIAILPTNQNYTYITSGVQAGSGKAVISARPTGFYTYYAENDIADSTWHSITGVFAGNTDRKTYVDGVVSASGSGTDSSIFPSAANNTSIGYLARPLTAGLGNGSIDEVRISNVTRSAEWLDAGYTNQNTPNTFYTVSAQAATEYLFTPAINIRAGAIDIR